MVLEKLKLIYLPTRPVHPVTLLFTASCTCPMGAFVPWVLLFPKNYPLPSFNSVLEIGFYMCRQGFTIEHVFPPLSTESFWLLLQLPSTLLALLQLTLQQAVSAWLVALLKAMYLPWSGCVSGLKRLLDTKQRNSVECISSQVFIKWAKRWCSLT